MSLRLVSLYALRVFGDVLAGDLNIVRNINKNIFEQGPEIQKICHIFMVPELW